MQYSGCEFLPIFGRRLGQKRRKNWADYYLSKAEEQLLQDVLTHFGKVIVVLNTGGMVDTARFKDDPRIKGVLYALQGGMCGGLAEADILCGDVCPSGRLTDILAADFYDFPSSEGFNESGDYVNYTEDIFVGYRYFETVANAYKKVNYPFRFGLSYTNFTIKCKSAVEKDGVITVAAEVLNIGSISGKEVVQLYTSSPYGRLCKPARELKAFAKTYELRQGETQTVILSFAVKDMASYDEECAAYILEKGV